MQSINAIKRFSKHLAVTSFRREGFDMFDAHEKCWSEVWCYLWNGADLRNYFCISSSSSWFSWSRPGHRASTTPTPLNSWLGFKSDQVLFRFLHFFATVRLHVSQGLQIPICPIPSRGFHCIACKATVGSSYRRVCPIQPHLCLLMVTSEGSCLIFK